MPESQEKKQNANVIDVLKRLAVLYADNVKLTAAEKLTVLMSGIALLTIILTFGVITLIFIAIGIASVLEDYIATYWSYFIIAGLLIVIVAVVVLLKDKLIVNPIARFLSKLIINPPKK